MRIEEFIIAIRGEKPCIFSGNLSQIASGRSAGGVWALGQVLMARVAESYPQPVEIFFRNCIFLVKTVYFGILIAAQETARKPPGFSATLSKAESPSGRPIYNFLRPTVLATGQVLFCQSIRIVSPTVRPLCVSNRRPPSHCLCCHRNSWRSSLIARCLPRKIPNMQ